MIALAHKRLAVLDALVRDAAFDETEHVGGPAEGLEKAQGRPRLGCTIANTRDLHATMPHTRLDAILGGVL